MVGFHVVFILAAVSAKSILVEKSKAISNSERSEKSNLGFIDEVER